MSTRKKLLTAFVPLTLFVLLTVLLWHSLGRDPEYLPSALTDQPVPDFSLPALESEQVLDATLFQGHWTLLNVWATWCPTCYVEHPYLLALATQGVRIVGLNYKDEQEKALDYLARGGNPYVTNIVDKDGTLGLDLGVYGAPETYVIDPHGVIRLRHAGELNERVWRNKIEPIWER